MEYVSSGSDTGKDAFVSCAELRVFLMLRVSHSMFYCIEVLPTPVLAFHMHVGYPQSPEEGVWSPGTRVTQGCGLPCGC